MRFLLLSCVLVICTIQASSSNLRAQSSAPQPRVSWTEDAPITALAWSGDGQSLAVASSDLLNPNDIGTIEIYDYPTETHQIVTESAYPTVALAWRESDRTLFSTHAEGFYFYGWDSTTGEQISIAPENGQGYGLGINPIDKRVAVSYGGVLTLYDANLETSLEDASYQPAFGEWIESYVVLWMPDGEHLITSGHPDAPEFMSMWSPEDGIVFSFKSSDELTPNKFDLHLALSADGEWLAAATGWIYNQTYQLTSPDLFIWSTEDGKIQHRLTSNSNGIMALDWSPDGQLLANAGQDGTLTLWDVTTESMQAEWTLSTSPLTALAWSNENQLAVGTSSGDVLIFDMSR